MSNSVDFWYLLISWRATVPGLYWWGFFTPPSTAAGVLFWAGTPDLPAPAVGFLWEALFCHSISCWIPLVNAGTRDLALIIMVIHNNKVLNVFLVLSPCYHSMLESWSESIIHKDCLLFFTQPAPTLLWCWFTHVSLMKSWIKVKLLTFEFGLHMQGPLLHADWLSDFPMGGPFLKVCLLS